LDELSPNDMSAKCAVNTALLDVASRRARKSVSEFLGIGFREQRHMTSFTIGIDDPDGVRRKTLAAANYPVLKMKVGVAGDRECFKALREVAPEKPIRVDANEGWKSKEQALEMIGWLSHDGSVEYVEQPLPASAPVSDWKWLKARTPLPIFADESYH